MRQENYANSVLQEIIEILRVSGVARHIRQQPPGTVVEDRLATAQEEAGLVAEEDEQQDNTEWQTIKSTVAGASGTVQWAVLKPILQKLLQRIEKKG